MIQPLMTTSTTSFLLLLDTYLGVQIRDVCKNNKKIIIIGSMSLDLAKVKNLKVDNSLIVI